MSKSENEYGAAKKTVLQDNSNMNAAGFRERLQARLGNAQLSDSKNYGSFEEES